MNKKRKNKKVLTNTTTNCTTWFLSWSRMQTME